MEEKWKVIDLEKFDCYSTSIYEVSDQGRFRRKTKQGYTYIKGLRSSGNLQIKISGKKISALQVVVHAFMPKIDYDKVHFVYKDCNNLNVSVSNIKVDSLKIKFREVDPVTKIHLDFSYRDGFLYRALRYTFRVYFQEPKPFETFEDVYHDFYMYLSDLLYKFDHSPLSWENWVFSSARDFIFRRIAVSQRRYFFYPLSRCKLDRIKRESDILDNALKIF